MGPFLLDLTFFTCKLGAKAPSRGFGYVRQGPQGCGEGSFLFSSEHESDLWRPEPPVCPPEALETLFTTDTNWSTGDGLALEVSPPFCILFLMP